jgi:hypothetical protein
VSSTSTRPDTAAVGFSVNRSHWRLYRHSSRSGIESRGSIANDGGFFELLVPSEGALYPLDLYVLAQNVDGITTIVERSLGKYEDRGHRYILVDAGHVAQT